jgi:hypothetical protein
VAGQEAPDLHDAAAWPGQEPPAFDMEALPEHVPPVFCIEACPEQPEDPCMDALLFEPQLPPPA